MPPMIWQCPDCGLINYGDEEAELYTCEICGHHFKLEAIKPEIIAAAEID